MKNHTIKIAENPDHPKLKVLKASLAKNPGMTKNLASNLLGIGYGTVLAWERKGWVKFKPFNKYTWGKQKGPVIPYDLNMKKVKK